MGLFSSHSCVVPVLFSQKDLWLCHRNEIYNSAPLMYMGHHKAETAESLDLLQQWRKIPMVCRKTEGRKRKMGEPKGTKRKKRKESPEAKEGGSTEKPSDQVECCSS